jgi:hypothetical protein
MCNVLLPPAVNSSAVNKTYHNYGSARVSGMTDPWSIWASALQNNSLYNLREGELIVQDLIEAQTSRELLLYTTQSNIPPNVLFFILMAPIHNHIPSLRKILCTRANKNNKIFHYKILQYFKLNEHYKAPTYPIIDVGIWVISVRDQLIRRNAWIWNYHVSIKKNLNWQWCHQWQPKEAITRIFHTLPLATSRETTLLIFLW